MKIPIHVYEALTPAQRVAAAVAAQARDDEAELERLKTSCPKITYVATDDAYAETMRALVTLSLAIESDLRGLAIDYLLAMRRKASVSAKDEILIAMASMQSGFRIVLEERGICPTDMDLAGAGHHALVSKLLEFCDGDEEPDQVLAWAEAIRKTLP